MTAMLVCLEIGSWADVAGALAALAGALLSVMALRVARDANALAERVAKEGQERERLRDEREDERERRSLAGGVQAWWAASEAPESLWGVVVCNSGQAVFSNVTVHTEGNRLGGQIQVEALPPGQFFVESRGGGEAKTPWGIPKPIQPDQRFLPLTKSAKHHVVRIDFVDPLGAKWSWTPTDGPRRSGRPRLG